MATIKDVAQLAGVSIGTVSNVLNGKTRNTDLIERVEKAMQELKYIPDETARSLKKEKTGLIGLILPNSVNPEYSSLLAEIEALLTQHGYSILLIFSHNNALLEKKAVEKCLKQRVDGIILYSPHRSSKQLEFAENQIPVVLISQKEDKHVKADTIILDYFPAFKAVMEYLKAIEKNNIAMIIDESFLQNEKVVDTYQEFWADQGIIVITDYSKEHGFRAAYELLYQKPEIDAIIAGNYLIAQGIKKASNVLKNRDLQIVVLKESNWIEDEQSFPVQITLSQKRIAELVVKRLLDAIDNPDTHEPIVKKVMAEYKETPSVFPDIDQTKKEIVLRFAMYESPTSTGIKLLSEIYMEHTGIKIKLDMYKYDELEKITYQVSNEQIKDYDGIMMDITWIDDLVKKDFLMGLKNSGIHFDDFIEGIEQQLGFYGGNYYSVPIMSGTQLLFYQKDLFESDEIKRLFTRLYERELKVPSSWAEFNNVAEFFTRSFNSKSPTKYGVSKVTGENIYTTIDFLNRLWSYGSDVFNHQGEVIINNSNSLMALKNFIKSYEFSSSVKLTTWDDVVKEFKSGDSAMAILYDSYAGDLNHYTKSKVAGNLGVAQIPGGTPVLGGWGIGINKRSPNNNEATKFLEWLTSNKTVLPLILLGGSTLRKSYYTNDYLENIFPWKKEMLESYKKSRKRILPTKQVMDKGRNYIYSHIISKQIIRAINNEISVEKALENMEREINKSQH